MMNARMSALERLLSQFDESGDEMLKKHSPKSVSIEVLDAKPAGEPDGDEGLPPEVLAKIVEALKAAKEPDGDEPMAEKMAYGGIAGEDDESLADKRQTQRSEEMDAAPAHLAHGGEVKESMTMGDRKCPGCGHMKSDCVCMSEGGLIEGDSLADEQMKRREEARQAEQDMNAEHDMEDLAGGKPRTRVAVRKSRYYKG